MVDVFEYDVLFVDEEFFVGVYVDCVKVEIIEVFVDCCVVVDEVVLQVVELRLFGGLGDGVSEGCLGLCMIVVDVLCEGEQYGLVVYDVIFEMVVFGGFCFGVYFELVVVVCIDSDVCQMFVWMCFDLDGVVDVIEGLVVGVVFGVVDVVF